MIEARFVPLTQWPNGQMRPDHKRKRSPFRATYRKTLMDLERELHHLGAKSIIIQAGFTDVRNDGWPYSGAKPKHPAVVLSFTARGGRKMMLPCDTYKTFEENLRAVALTLSALKAIDRYGVTEHEEQYRGFAQIEAPPAPGTMDYETAERLIAGLAGVPVSVLRDRAQRDVVIREAKRSAHPDSPNGSHDAFVQLQDALGVVERAA